MRVGLVGCVKTKSRRAAPARDLYLSPLFRGRRSYVETSCDRWFILSAKHGLVSPDDVLEPYDEALNDKSTAAKRTWSASVVAQLVTRMEIRDSTFEVHAGSDYRNFGLVSELRRRGAHVEVPAEHLTQGEQIAFYRRTDRATAQEQQPKSQVGPNASDAFRVRGSYAPLADHLIRVGSSASTEQMPFAPIERILGRPLPASARRHRAWWANESDGTHSHARSWMGVGWLVDAVDFNSGLVRFRRGRR